MGYAINKSDPKSPVEWVEAMNPFNNQIEYYQWANIITSVKANTDPITHFQSAAMLISGDVPNSPNP